MMRHTISMMVNRTDEYLLRWKRTGSYPDAAKLAEHTETLVALILDLLEENEYLTATSQLAGGAVSSTTKSTTDGNTGQYL